VTFIRHRWGNDASHVMARGVTARRPLALRRWSK
jgi:hypothetical protein